MNQVVPNDPGNKVLIEASVSGPPRASSGSPDSTSSRSRSGVGSSRLRRSPRLTIVRSAALIAIGRPESATFSPLTDPSRLHGATVLADGSHHPWTRHDPDGE